MSSAVCSQCQQTTYDQMSDMHIHFMNMYGAKNIKTEHDSQRHELFTYEVVQNGVQFSIQYSLLLPGGLNPVETTTG